MTTDLYLILKRRCGLIDGYGFNGARLTREEQYLIGLLPKAPKSNGQLEKLPRG